MAEKMRVDAKRVLADSLIELSARKPLAKVTIQDIVDNCGASRQTFYNHFTGKYELVDWIVSKNSDEVIRKFIGVEPWSRVLAKTLGVLKENQALYGGALGKGGLDSFWRSLYQYTRDFYIDSIRDRFGPEAVTDRLVFTMRFNSYGAVAREWAERGMNEPPEAIAGGIVHNMPADLKRYFQP